MKKIYHRNDLMKSWLLLTLLTIILVPKPTKSFTVSPTYELSFTNHDYGGLIRRNKHSRSFAFCLNAKKKNSKKKTEANNNDDNDTLDSIDVEIVNDDDEFQYDEEDDWIPDKEKAKRRAQKQNNMRPAEDIADPPRKTTRMNKKQQPAGVHIDDINMTPSASRKEKSAKTKKRLQYTEEEEDLIQALGGKEGSGKDVKREDGFLGDCTLKEIASDFQVPVCYLADVLCTWGVPAPIDVYARLGDMVTGEQAFAILEAIHTLDLGVLNERYSNMDLMTVCDEYGIELKDAFDFVVKENYNLPFGVRTFLRVEQEDELIKNLVKEDWM